MVTVKQHQTLRVNMLRPALLITAALLVTSTTAQAHTGVGDATGFIHGFGHPLSGIDHILAVVALGGRALWLVPLSFVSMMIAGGAFGLADVHLPFVEVGVGLSVVVLGVAVATGFHTPTAAAMALVGFFAIFHGHAHGAEMPESASGFEYGGGFVLATAILHACGIGIGLLVGRLPGAYGTRVLQVTGSAMALIGIAILTGGAMSK
jgi:urease accessory protein